MAEQGATPEIIASLNSVAEDSRGDELLEFEQQFPQDTTANLNRLRSYVQFLGIVDDEPHCLTTTTPDSEWVMFVEKSGLGNPYHKRIRAFETRYDKITHGVLSRDILLDVTDLRMSILELPVFRAPEFTAERAPCLSLLGNESLMICEGKLYQSLFAKKLEDGLTEAPVDPFDAEAVLSKYAKGTVFNIVSQERFSGIEDALQARSLSLAA
jgi:hypothetical protein